MNTKFYVIVAATVFVVFAVASAFSLHSIMNQVARVSESIANISETVSRIDPVVLDEVGESAKGAIDKGTDSVANGVSKIRDALK